MKTIALAISAVSIALVSAANAQAVSDQTVVQDFVIAGITSDQATMRAQLAPNARLSISEGRVFDHGKLTKAARPADIAEFGVFFANCRFEMSIGSTPGVQVTICPEQGAAKKRLILFKVTNGKITEATLSRGWVSDPAIVRIPAAAHG